MLNPCGPSGIALLGSYPMTHSMMGPPPPESPISSAEIKTFLAIVDGAFEIMWGHFGHILDQMPTKNKAECRKVYHWLVRMSETE
jgi:hypothetical protein